MASHIFRIFKPDGPFSLHSHPDVPRVHSPVCCLPPPDWLGLPLTVLGPARNQRKPDTETARSTARCPKVSAFPLLVSHFSLSLRLLTTPGIRTYRDKRDRYTRSLEEEVARVRANEANLLREVKRLRHTVQTLARTRGEQGLDVLDDLDGNSPLGQNVTGLHGKKPAPTQVWYMLLPRSLDIGN